MSTRPGGDLGGRPDRTNLSTDFRPMTRSLTKKLVRFLRDEDGPTAVEYAFLLALILLIAITSMKLFGMATNTCFENSEEEFGRYMP